VKASVELCINKFSDTAAKSELEASCEKFGSELRKLGTLDGFADSCVSSGMAFWRVPKYYQIDHPHTQKLKQVRMNQLPRHLFAKPPRKSVW